MNANYWHIFTPTFLQRKAVEDKARTNIPLWTGDEIMWTYMRERSIYVSHRRTITKDQIKKTDWKTLTNTEPAAVIYVRQELNTV